MAREPEPREPAQPPEGPEGHNSLADLSEEAVREIEKRRDGSGGYAGEGDIG
ncbi:MAG: hypothetical protein QOH04_337 [Sphingomonadales bacterium]|jgi:hypothetical protein|nr:hypothetical protein [Sphingomonadales bacterium]MEA3034578.1 hypothetical protein [Sphingomonadales bacterium]